MRMVRAIISLGACLLAANVSQANPFRSSYVCVPAVNPSRSPLEFRVRESSACRENETLLKVYSQGNEAILLYPAPAPASAEDEETLKRYKEFYGITP